jgi:hypothetical protein
MFTPFNDASYFGTKTRVTMSEADNISSPLERPGRGHLAWDIQWDIQKIKYEQNPCPQSLT